MADLWSDVKKYAHEAYTKKNVSAGLKLAPGVFILPSQNFSTLLRDFAPNK